MNQRVDSLLDELINEIKQQANEEEAEKMAAYMKNEFLFLGVKKPIVKTIIKPFLKETKKESINWEWINKLWDMDFREAQYMALLYMDAHKKELRPEHMNHLKRLIVTKSWWDTVDEIDRYVGIVVLQEEALKSVMIEWSQDENIWLQRIAINFQQKYIKRLDGAFENIVKQIQNGCGYL